MFQRPDFGNVSVQQSIPPQNVAANLNGNAVDRIGYDGVLVIFDVGALAAFDNAKYYDLRVQVSSDNAAWENSGEAVQVRAGGQNQVHTRAVLTQHRYVRAQAVEAGDGSSLHLSATVLLERAQYPS